MRKYCLIRYFLTFLFIFIIIVQHCYAQNTSQAFTSSMCNEFTFDATGSFDQEGGKLLYQWNFGDGTSSNEPTITHTYEKPGIYSVTLTITDEEGLSSFSTQKVQANIAPIINLTAPESVCAGQSLQMQAFASYALSQKKLFYQWNFGDGTTAENKKEVSKVYAKGGNYKIRVTVDDRSGVVCSSKSIDHTVRVNAPPQADAGPAEIVQCVDGPEDYTLEFDAATTFDVNGDELTYSWDFGDLSAIKKGKKVTHQFNDLGVYDVKLLVDDNTDMGCGSSVDFVKVQLNEAPKAEAGVDLIGCPDELLIFDGSPSNINPPGTAIGKWDFGDGNGTNGIRASYAYNKAGEYTAQLTIESILNTSCPQSVDQTKVFINAPPTAILNAPEQGCVGEEIAFTSSGVDEDGDALEYYWSFGDGTILRGQDKVTHIYETGGTYQVSVIVDDKKGTSCSTATSSKSIQINTPPKANIGTNQSCCVDVEATFDGSGSLDIDNDDLSYLWDFGDGNKSTGAVTKYAYKKNGKFTVTLTIDDNKNSSCSQSTDSFTTEINTTPVPIITIR